MLQILLSQGPSCSSKISFFGAEGSYHCPRSWQRPKISRVESVGSEWNGKLEPNVTTNIHKPMIADAMKCNHHFSIGIWVTILLWIWRLALGIWWWLLSTLEFSWIHWFLKLSMNTRIIELERAKLKAMWTVQTCPNIYHVSTFGTVIYIRNESSTYSVDSQYKQSGKGILLKLQQWCANILIGSPVSFNIIHSCVTSAGWYRKPKAACARSSSGLGAWWQTWRKQRRNKTAAKFDPFWFFRLGYHLSEISTARNLIQ